MAQKKEGLSKKLATYSVAAAAALAIAPAADAAVVYSGVQNLPLNTVTAQVIDLNNDGQDDFRFAVSTALASIVFMSNQSGGAGVIYGTLHNDPGRLTAGYTVQSSIGPSFYWRGSVLDVLNGSCTYGTNTCGSFNAGSGYLGVRIFDTTCREAYGWIHYAPVSNVSGTIIDWAYEDGCGPIQAGLNTVPTMGEWGMFLLAGLLSAAAIKAINREVKA